MLRSCAGHEGASVVVDGDPGVQTYRDVLYVPLGCGAAPGLYGRDRIALSSGLHLMGWPTRGPALESWLSDLDPETVPYAPGDVPYFYGHHVTGHYGHFLFSVLSRLWALPYGRASDFKVLVLNPTPRHALNPFSRSILDAVGLDEAGLVGFEVPVRLRRVTVPRPAISENVIAYTAFRGLCRTIGRVLVPTSTVSRTDRPVFLSKARLTRGISTIVNEGDMLETLERHGVEIVYPELISIEEQVRLFRERRNILGIAGSALHGSIFGDGSRIVGLSTRDAIMGNYAMIDRLCGNRALYLFPEGIEQIEGTTDFENRFRLPDPKAVAERMLAIADGQPDH